MHCNVSATKEINIVTVMSYKNTSVVNDRGYHPITLGPLLLHGESPAEVYGDFLHHVSSKVNYDLVQNVIIGCDDEKAIRKAIRNTMPLATNIM